jgi:hypothetical protein
MVYAYDSVLVLFFQRALAFTTERKTALVGDAYSKPLVTIRSHDLHAGDIRGIMGDACFKPPITIRFHDLHAGDIRRVISDACSKPPVTIRSHDLHAD